MTPILLALAVLGGTMETLQATATPRVVVAAPHGGFDRFTDQMGRRIALLAGAGYMIADGYRTRSGPINVNRPTEGAGVSPEEERQTPAAAAVWAQWRARLDAQRPDLYVEIHGNSRAASAHHIEVAVVNVDAFDAARLRDAWAARLGTLPAGMPRLPLALEPLESLHYRGQAAKARGALGRVPRALQFELPAALRVDEATRDRYSDMLASLIAAYAAGL